MSKLIFMCRIGAFALCFLSDHVLLTKSHAEFMFTVMDYIIQARFMGLLTDFHTEWKLMHICNINQIHSNY